MSNVFKKLQSARLKLSQTSLKKSGKNRFAGYEYFELGDFMPSIHKIFDEVGLCGVVNFDAHHASLTVFDTEKDERICFQTPIVMAENPKAQAIQSLGSTHTYMRRYLWLLCLEIVEHDSIDALPQAVKEKVKPMTLQSVVEKIVEESYVEKDTFVELLISLGEECTSVAELASVWKLNQSQIDALKTVGNVDLYEKLVKHFNEYKLKFKKD